jgi:putative endonuclease
MSAAENWLVYLLKCSDNTLYCGVTNNLTRRLRQHNGEIKGGAKYTKYRRPCKVVFSEFFNDKSSAMKREYEIKQLSRTQKQSLLDPNF